MAKGGVQELMGFQADLCTFAKAMGNGYPISVVAGREDIMEQGSATAWSMVAPTPAHSVSLAAAEQAPWRSWTKPSALRDHRATTAVAMQRQASSRILERPRHRPQFLRATHRCAGCSSMRSPPRNYRDWVEFGLQLLRSAMALPNCMTTGVLLCEPDSREPFFICEAHAADDCSRGHARMRFEQAVDRTIESQSQAARREESGRQHQRRQ